MLMERLLNYYTTERYRSCIPPNNHCAPNSFVTFLQISAKVVNSLDLRVSQHTLQSGAILHEEYKISLPMCFIHVIGELSSSSSKLKVDGLRGLEQQSSEFSLLSPKHYSYKFEAYQPTDPHIITEGMFLYLKIMYSTNTTQMQSYTRVCVCACRITCVCVGELLCYMWLSTCVYLVLHTRVLNKARVHKCLSIRVYLVSRYTRVANM